MLLLNISNMIMGAWALDYMCPRTDPHLTQHALIQNQQSSYGSLCLPVSC